MEIATQWDSSEDLKKILFEEMSKTCHVSMFRGIPTFDKILAQQHLCSNEESQEVTSGEYGDCHTLGQF
jgi:hypothetical protein